MSDNNDNNNNNSNNSSSNSNDNNNNAIINNNNDSNFLESPIISYDLNNNNYNNNNSNDKNDENNTKQNGEKILKSLVYYDSQGEKKYKPTKESKFLYNIKSRSKIPKKTAESFSTISELRALIEGLESTNKKLQEDLSEIKALISEGNISTENIFSESQSSAWNKHFPNENKSLLMEIPSTPVLSSQLNNLYGVNEVVGNDQSPLSKDMQKLLYTNARVLDSLSRKHKKKAKWSSKQLQNIVYKFHNYSANKLFSGFSEKEHKKRFLKESRTEVFNPCNISYAMDNCEQSSLNFGAVGAFREIGISKDYQRGAICSVAATQRYFYDLNNGIQTELITPTIKKNKSCNLDALCVIKKLIEACEELKKYGVTTEDEFRKQFSYLTTIYFTLTLDGAKLTEHTAMTILAIGSKVKELVSVLSADTKRRSEKKKTDIITKIKSHSHRNYTLIGFMDHNDTKENAKIQAEDSLKLSSQINKDQMLFIESISLWFKIAIIICMDLKAIWTIMGVGCGSSKGDYFCCFCNARGHNKGTPNIEICENCKTKKKTKCYCYPIISGKTISMYCNETSEKVPPRKQFISIAFPVGNDLVDKMKTFGKQYLKFSNAEEKLKKEVIWERISTAKRRYEMLTWNNISIIDIKEIYFHLELRHHEYNSQNFKDACREHGIQLNQESHLIDTEACRNVLKKLILEGDLIGFCHQFKSEASLFKDPYWVCICLMHLIMRISEKIITCLLQEGIKCENVRGKDIKQKIEKLINLRLSNVKDLSNTEVNSSDANNVSDDDLVGEFVPSTFARVAAEEADAEVKYEFHINFEGDNKSKVTAFKISYVRVFKVMEIISDIIDACGLDPVEEIKYRNLFESWNIILELLLKEDAFSEADINNLENEIETFRDLLFDLHGSNIVTNYIHILIAGHLTEMIKRFGNIAIYSGIGFECLVGKVRSFYFKRCNKSGHVGNVAQLKVSCLDNMKDFMARKFARALGKLHDASPNGDKSFIHNLFSKGNSKNKTARNNYSKAYRSLHAIRRRNEMINNMNCVVDNIINSSNGLLMEEDVKKKLFESLLNSKLYSKLLVLLIDKKYIKNPSQSIILMSQYSLARKCKREEFLQQFGLELNI